MLLNPVTWMTRRETVGSKCKLFIEQHGQYRQGRAGANRYGMGKTQESPLFIYLYSAFNNTNCDKATAQYQNEKIVSIM